MKIWEKIKNWIIILLGGYTKEQYNGLLKASSIVAEKYEKANNSVKTVETMLEINKNLGYTVDNVIKEAQQQVYYQLGKEVYPFAKHFITGDNKYICSVNLKDFINKEK